MNEVAVKPRSPRFLVWADFMVEDNFQEMRKCGATGEAGRGYVYGTLKVPCRP